MKDEIDEDEPVTLSASTSTSTDTSTQYGNARATRNLAEKQRRDNLNNNIALMAALVPVVAGSSRRQDKISILRLAAAFLRTHYTVGTTSQEFLPDKYNDIDLEQSFLDSFDGSGGFLIVVTSSGNIVHISKSIEGPLGHAPNELMGKSLYSYIHPEDHTELTKNLTPDESLLDQTAAAISNISNIDDNNSNSSNDSNLSSSNTNNNNNNNNNINNFREQRRNFNIKFAQRTNSRGEHTQYKCFNITGMLRLSNYCRNRPGKSKNTTSNDIIFVGIARQLQRRFTKLSLFEASKEEYVTRHLVDGRIIFCDHRISVVAGYMSEEVSGSSAFRYMHKDDVRWTIIALRQMYDCRLEFGASCYRLLSKTGDFIYLRTHGFLEFDKQTGTFESFVCVNTLVDEEEGEKLIKEMKERFSAIITNSNSRSIIETDNNEINEKSKEAPGVEDPSQLEGVILQLINGLSPSPTTITDVPLVSSPNPEIQYAKAAMYSQHMPPVNIHTRQIGLASSTSNSSSLILQNNNHDKCIKSEIQNIKSPDNTITNNNNNNSDKQESSSSTTTTTTTNSVIQKISHNNYNKTSEKNIITELDDRISPVNIIDENISIVNTFNSKNIYENDNDKFCEIQDNKLSPSVSSHRGKPDSMIMYIKTEKIDGNLICGKRSLDTTNGDNDNDNNDNDDDNNTSKKRQRNEYFNNSPEQNKSSLQDIMKSNPDILKMLDEIGHVMNTEPDPNIPPSLSQHYASEQVDETLRNLEDRITYQENQLDELGLVIENSDLHSQRDNYDQLQAEHEIQKKMIKTLQQDHHSMKVINVKQNIGV